MGSLGVRARTARPGTRILSTQVPAGSAYHSKLECMSLEVQ